MKKKDFVCPVEECDRAYVYQVIVFSLSNSPSLLRLTWLIIFQVGLTRHLQVHHPAIYDSLPVKRRRNHQRDEQQSSLLHQSDQKAPSARLSYGGMGEFTYSQQQNRYVANEPTSGSPRTFTIPRVTTSISSETAASHIPHRHPHPHRASFPPLIHSRSSSPPTQLPQKMVLVPLSSVPPAEGPLRRANPISWPLRLAPSPLLLAPSHPTSRNQPFLPPVFPSPHSSPQSSFSLPSPFPAPTSYCLPPKMLPAGPHSSWPLYPVHPRTEPSPSYPPLMTAHHLPNTLMHYA